MKKMAMAIWFLLLWCFSGWAQPAIPSQYFPFQDVDGYETLFGGAPLGFSNLISTSTTMDSFYGNVLILDATNLAPAFLNYNVQDTNYGVTRRNLNYSSGTALWYFAPNWASVTQGGTGPDATAYFIAGGDWSTNSPHGLFTIYADAGGSNLYFGGVEAGDFEIYASAPIAWSSNVFHQIGVEWTGGDCEIYVDGALAATGDGVMYVPTHATWTNGWFLGSDATGLEQVRGAMFGLTTWNEEAGGSYTNGWLSVSNALATWQASLGGGGFGRMMGMGTGIGFLSGVTYTTNYADYTNFWLTVETTDTSTNVVVTIQNTQSNLTYHILTNSVVSTNLTNWGVWQTLLATNSVIVSPIFNINTNTTALFFDASLVWSTTTNGLPDWYEMEYFGNLHQLASGDYDGDGVNNGNEYTNGTDPNKISFQISFTNQYANLTNVPLSLGIQGGVPYYGAVMLDSTNFPAASWTAYTSSNITASLGTNQGWHTVWVGLRGLPATAQQTWNAVRLDLDLTPPRLVVTNATNVAIPMIQLQGYASEELSSLRYDLTNASGAISNQTGFMTGAIFDTNSFAYTNATFKCFDLALVSGVNRVTLHATDLAGNTTTSNFIFNLDYSSKPPPVLQLYWPQNGAQISGGSFTWRGTVDDPTVALTAQITDTNGDTNVVAGVIERNGNFWVDNLPLGSGTNYLALTATDIHSNVTTTNISVVQSSVTITINPISSDLNQGTATVTGAINAVSNYSVWVNGVLAITNASTNSWTATNVPMNGAGSAVVQAEAILDTATNNYGNGTNGGGGTNSSLSNPGNPAALDRVITEINQDKAAAIICDYFHNTWTWNYFASPYGGTSPASYIDTEVNEITDWSAQTGGQDQYTECSAGVDIYSNPFSSYYANQSQWDVSGTGTWQYGTSYDQPCGTGTTWNPPEAYTGPTWSGLQGQSFAMVPGSPVSQSGLPTATAHFLFNTTGGRSVSGRQSLHRLDANVEALLDPWYPYDWASGFTDPFSSPYFGDVAPQAVYMMGEPEFDNGVNFDGSPHGSLYIDLPDGEVLDPSPHVLSVAYRSTALSNTTFSLVISANAIALDPDNVNPSAVFCVGQQVNFSFTGNPSGTQSTNITWSFNGDFITASNHPATGSPIYTNDPTLLTNQTASAWWMSGGSTAAGTTYTATMTETLIFTNGNTPQTVTNHGRFTMYRPAIYFYTNNFYNPGDNDVGGAIFTNVVSGVTNIMLGTFPEADFTAYIHSIFSGPAGITQLLKGYATNSIGGLNTTNTYQLDNAEFYSTPPFTGPSGLRNVIAGAQGSYTNNIVTINDAPDINCTNNNAALHLDFTDYIRFKPAGGNSNIFVTLGIVNWHIYETAALTNSIYVFSSGPNGHIDPIYTDSKTFPVWTNVANNVAP